jgi:glutathione S-transferase
VLRVHRIPFSTNVERVALAAAHKGLPVEWVDHDPSDRSAIHAVSGQELVPVLELEGEVVVDSTRILERLELLAPEPPLYPADPAMRARLELFLEWFNEVWKRPPNEIEAELRRPAPDRDRIDALGARMRGWLDLFERLLSGSDHLLGRELSAADVAAFPFLKFAAIPTLPGDEEAFHRILAERQQLDGGFPRLRDWIARVDALPRA